MRIRPACRAFTLVELLVVIGIIALLISILLPALGAARRQAAQTKCLSSMKQIYNAYLLYSIDSKGFFPPAKVGLDTATSNVYNIDGDDFPGSGRNYGPFWFNFVSKYVQKAKVGEADASGAELGTMKNRSVLWGCPAFEGYSAKGADISTNQTNRVQIGYAMNGYPSFTASYPGSTTTNNPFGGSTTTTAKLPPGKEWAYTPYTDAAGATVYWDKLLHPEAGFVKQSVYGRQGALRALIADGSLWLMESKPAALPLPLQFNDANANLDTDGQTTISMWRHGKLPAAEANNTTGWPKFPVGKGKMGYNILYCDGHAASTQDPKEAFKSSRMKFPG